MGIVNKVIFVLFTIGFLMIQPLTASAFLIPVDPIDAVKFAISFGEEAAIEAAGKIPIEIVLGFFKNLEFDSNLVNVYHVLLTVIFEYSPAEYSVILVAIPELQSYEVQRATEKLMNLYENFI